MYVCPPVYLHSTQGAALSFTVVFNNAFVCAIYIAPNNMMFHVLGGRGVDSVGESDVT